MTRYLVNPIAQLTADCAALDQVLLGRRPLRDVLVQLRGNDDHGDESDNLARPDPEAVAGDSPSGAADERSRL